MPKSNLTAAPPGIGFIVCQADNRFGSHRALVSVDVVTSLAIVLFVVKEDQRRGAAEFSATTTKLWRKNRSVIPLLARKTNFGRGSFL